VKLAAILACLAAAPPAVPDTPPGGYWRMGEKRAPEPLDGQDNLTIGAIMASLGVIRTGGGIAYVVLARPGECGSLEERTGISRESCPELRAYGWAGTALGGAMFVTGVVMLAIGAAQRKRHRAWQRRYGIALGPGGLSTSF
jgi:hypothetical protein